MDQEQEYIQYLQHRLQRLDENVAADIIVQNNLVFLPPDFIIGIFIETFENIHLMNPTQNYWEFLLHVFPELLFTIFANAEKQDMAELFQHQMDNLFYNSSIQPNPILNKGIAFLNEYELNSDHHPFDQYIETLLNIKTHLSSAKTERSRKGFAALNDILYAFIEYVQDESKYKVLILTMKYAPMIAAHMLQQNFGELIQWRTLQQSEQEHGLNIVDAFNEYIEQVQASDLMILEYLIQSDVGYESEWHSIMDHLKRRLTHLQQVRQNIYSVSRRFNLPSEIENETVQYLREYNVHIRYPKPKP